jgi:hypothetical protein
VLGAGQAGVTGHGPGPGLTVTGGGGGLGVTGGGSVVTGGASVVVGGVVVGGGSVVAGGAVVAGGRAVGRGPTGGGAGRPSSVVLTAVGSLVGAEVPGATDAGTSGLCTPVTVLIGEPDGHRNTAATRATAAAAPPRLTSCAGRLPDHSSAYSYAAPSCGSSGGRAGWAGGRGGGIGAGM